MMEMLFPKSRKPGAGTGAMLGALCLRCHLESPEETTAVCSRVKSTGMTFKVMATRCLGVEAGRPRPWHCSCEARKRGEARRVRGEGGVHMPTPGLECVCVDGWVGCPDPKEDEGPGQPDPLLWSRGDKRPLEGCFSAHRAPAGGSGSSHRDQSSQLSGWG